MKTRLYIIGILFVAAWLTGCSITKRVHRGGYHVEWHKRYKNDIRNNVSNNENNHSVSNTEPEMKEFVLNEMVNVDSFAVMPIEEPKSNRVLSTTQKAIKKVNPIIKKSFPIKAIHALSAFKMLQIDDKVQESRERNWSEKQMIAVLIYFLIFVISILVILQYAGVILLIPVTLGQAALVVGIILTMITGAIIPAILFQEVKPNELRKGYKIVYLVFKYLCYFFYWAIIAAGVAIILALLFYIVAFTIVYWHTILLILIALAPGVLSGLVFFLIGCLIQWDWSFGDEELLGLHVLSAFVAVIFYMNALNGLAVLFAINALGAGIVYLISCF